MISLLVVDSPTFFVDCPTFFVDCPTVVDFPTGAVGSFADLPTQFFQPLLCFLFYEGNCSNMCQNVSLDRGRPVMGLRMSKKIFFSF